MSVTGEEILAVASREIGYREGKGTRTKYGEWYGLQGKPWCMEFVQWVYHTAGMDLPIKTAGCGTLLRWYKRNQPDCITNRPIQGSIAIFDLPNTGSETDHTGLFVKFDGQYIVTIDGNTSNESEGNGGWVQQRRRKLSYANPIYITPRGLVEMKRYQTLEEIEREAKWAYPTIKKLVEAHALGGTGSGLDLSEDMIREFVVNDRMGCYDGNR